MTTECSAVSLSSTTRAFLFLAFSVSTIFLGGCEDITFHSNQPRFVYTQDDPTPTRLNHYPGDFDDHIATAVQNCDALGNPIAGFDILHEYRKRFGEPSSTERFFQRVTVTGTVSVTTSQSQDCGDVQQNLDETIVEMFKPSGASAWDVLARHICNEAMMVLRFNGEVGLLDLDDLPQMPPISNNANVVILSVADNATQVTTVHPDLALLDVQRANVQLDAEKKTIIWTGQYEYDGCHGPGARITSCGPDAVHCLSNRSTDSVGSRARRWQR